MKMRIRGNSLRLRVTQPELAQLASAGLVEDSISFGPAQTITYALRSAGNTITASLQNHRIEITLPTAFVQSWFTSDTVGTQTKLDLGQNQSLSILVEKDFVCLTPQPEDQPGAFPNPHKTC